MATLLGTYDISTLLAARFSSAAAYGMNTIREILDADIAAHNALVTQMLSEICEVTTDRQRIYGSSATGEMIEVDEYGRAPTQRVQPGSSVGFPLRLYQYSIGWTRKFMETASPADLAMRTQAAESAHLRNIQREIKRAVFLSSNYTFNDHLVDNVDLAVKRFVNADSALIPNGPNGETFDGASHTHFTAESTSALTAANLTASIQTVIEHGHGNNVKVAICTTNEAAVRALSGFVAYVDPRVVSASTSTVGRVALDVSRLDNRAIGVFSGAEVWVKPWVPAGYYFSWDSGSPNKPLAFRQRTATSLQGLRIAAEIDDYPLLAQYMEAEFGIGVWNRTNGACHYSTSTTYADPTLTTY
jgi:hypothetical protein